MFTPKFKIFFIAIVLLTAGSSCLFPPGRITPTVIPVQTKSPTSPSVANPTQTATPASWKAINDSNGVCQVTVPPEWKLGVDFFLDAEKTNPSPFESVQGEFPPLSSTLDANLQMSEVHQYQIRKSLVNGSHVCSVWRTKQKTDFTDAEKREMEKVGQTLQEVQQ
jgi:hypothetical protein